jgi:hypothetical protein
LRQRSFSHSCIVRTHATTKRGQHGVRPGADNAPPAAAGTLPRHAEAGAGVSHEGMINVGGNAYSVADTARRRVLEVHCLIDEIQIFEGGILIARHTPLPGRGQSRIDPTHRKALQRSRRDKDDTTVAVRGAGDLVARRSLEFYDALGRVMAVKGNA